MAIDPRRGARVAWLAWLVACGPAVRPDRPPPEPGPVINNLRRPPPKARGRQLVLGEMCPQGAGGRPAVAPLMMRTHAWIDNPADVGAIVERGSVPRFVVFGVDGKTAGLFDTLGLAEIAPGQAVAAGTYVGASPCTAEAAQGQRIEDPTCAPATRGCGLAIGEITRPDEDRETIAVTTGGACVQGDALAIDIDGDQVLEQFPLAGVLDGIRSPAAEWTAAPVVGATCTPKFELFGIKIVPHLEAGKGAADKHIVGLDVLGIADLDADGRMEVVLALAFPTVRTIVVYTSTGSPQRLELAGEGQAFAR